MDQPTKEAIYEILLDSIREVEEVMVIPTGTDKLFFFLIYNIL